jgi:hypothetical protein
VRWPSTKVVINESGRVYVLFDRRDCDRFDNARESLLGGLLIGGKETV